MKVSFFIAALAGICLGAKAQFAKDSISVIGYLPASIDEPDFTDIEKDSIIIMAWDNFYPISRETNIAHRQYTRPCPYPSQHFSFTIPAPDHPFYFTISRWEQKKMRRREIMRLYIAEPGDSIRIIQFDSPQMIFWGRGSAKYNCRRALDQQTLFSQFEPGYLCPDSSGQLAVLNQYAQDISPEVRLIMMADILFQAEQFAFERQVDQWGNSSYGYPWIKFHEEMDSIKLRGRKRAAFATAFARERSPTIVGETPSASRRYIEYLLNKEVVMNLFLSDNPDEVFEALVNNYSGATRDRLLLAYLADRGMRSNRFTIMLNQAMKVAYRQETKNMLNDMIANRASGGRVFDFTLPNEKGELIRLSDFAGKTVLLDFWFTGCTACRYYYQEFMQPAEKHFANDARVVFMTINVDRDEAQWKSSLSDTQFVYTSAKSVNLFTAGRGAEDPVIAKLNVLSYPTVILIGPDGKLITRSNEALRSDVATLIKTISNTLQ